TDTEKTGFCALGSVKTNIGHTDTSAGVAGLIKTVLAVEHGLLPPSLHFEQPNPEIDFPRTPFYVGTELAKWQTEGSGQPRRAGVNSFGIGGTNAHAIIEQAPPPPPSGPSRRCQLLVLSARSENALETMTDNLAQHLRAHPELPPADVAFSLQVGRAAFEQRRILVCAAGEAAAALVEPERLLSAAVSREQGAPAVVFLFPGQGSQYLGMGRELYDTEATFRREVDRCCELLEPHLGVDLREVIPLGSGTHGRTQRSAPTVLEQTAITQPALFVVEYALARLWMEWGVRPQALVGHSIGEYVAATLAGVLTLEDALSLVSIRGALMQETAAGAMLSIALPAEQVLPLLDRELTLAAVNSPGLCVVSGPSDAIEALREAMADRQVQAKVLRTSHAFHSLLMEPILDRFRREVEKFELKPPQIPYLSNLSGTWIRNEEAVDPGYWVRHLRNTVRFSAAVEELLGRRSRIFLEVGPGRTLQPVLRQHPGSRGRLVLHSIRRAQSETETILRNLGQLWLAGVDVDWSGFYAHQTRRRVALPTYPFERQRFWIEPGEQLFSALAQPPGPQKLETLDEWFFVPSWQRSAVPGEVTEGEGEGRWLLLVDECGLGQEMARQLTAAGGSVVTVRPGEAFERLGPGSYTLRPAERSDYDALLADLRRDGGIPRHWGHLWSVTAAAGPAPGQRPADALELGFYSLLAQLQALGGQGFAEPLRLAVVSNGVQSVVGDEPLWPEKAAVLGPCKVIPEEYSNLRSSSIDVTPDFSEPLAELAGYLIAELRAGLPDPVAAYREGTRWVPSYEATPLPTVEELDLVHRGVYLITGGLGGLGLVFARYLAESFQAGLILTHHSSFPVREQWDLWLSSHGDDDRTSVRIRELRALEELGSEVAVEQADAADERTMHEVIKRARDELGPLRGVIHAAGVAGGGVIQLKEREVAAEVLRSKVAGMRVLEAVTADAAPDFIVLFSSISAVVGTFGQVDYCAANNVLDAFARKLHRRRPEMRTVAVNWGLWNEVGMGAAAERDPELARVGISPAEGVEAWRRILSHHRGPQVVASAVDLDDVIASQARARRVREGFEEALPAAPVRRSRHARPDVSTPYVAPRNEFEVRVAEIWQEMLGIEQVGLYDNFFDIGGHSLLMAQVRVRLGRELKRDVPLVDLFRFPTIRTLADHLSGAEKSSRRRRPAPATAGGETAIVGISCRFPGAEDVDEFWRNLCDGVDSVRTLSDEELTAAGVDRTIWSTADYVRASAEIRDPDCFDAGLFDFSPREAEILDPQHRIFLETAWSALEAAGCDPTRFDGRIGVYGGTGRGHYAMNLFANPELVRTMGAQALTLAVAADTLATRVSYKLDLKGPSVVVQSACSTALVAVHMARQALLKGECDMALAGAVAVGNFQPQGYQYTTGGILSPDGHCRAFDAGAAGSIFSSGAGIVVLKRLADAVADGDVIHAVIKGSAINNDGALKVGYTAPSED
ncbi:MAG: SDR family NAD(P)-dependent oxidoreductase, partial [bacterium]|nr:SDR family NAD(P)-dependent oxidoreductase [bacterium]